MPFNPDGSAFFTNSSTSNSFNFNPNQSFFSFNTPFGSVLFSNGDIYNTVAGSTPLQGFGSITNMCSSANNQQCWTFQLRYEQDAGTSTVLE